MARTKRGATLVTAPSSERHPSPVTPQDLGIGRLFWAIRDAVVAADVHSGQIVLWNPAAERMFGYAAADIVGHPLERLMPERMRPAHAQGLAHYRATGHGALIDAGLPVEVPALRRDGTELTVELSLSPVEAARETGWRGPYVLAIIRDVTERKQAEADRLRRERDAAVVASSVDAIVGLSLEGTFTAWNPAAERMYGYRAEEVIGQPAAPLVPPELRADLAAKLAAIARGETLPPYETVRIRKDGTPIDVWATLSPVHDAAGQVIGATVLARDISERKRAEREREALLERERAARLQAEHAASRAESLQAITAALALAATEADVAHVVIERGLRGVGAEAGAVARLTDDGSALEMLSTVGYPPPMVAALSRQPLSATTPMSQAARTRQPVWRETAAAAESAFVDFARVNPGYPSGAALPLLVEGRLLGAVGLSFADPRAFGADERGFMEALAGQCALALERVRLLRAERAAREQLDAILGGVADGVVVQHEDGRFIYANDAAAHLAGFASAAEYLGADAADISQRLIVLDEEGQPFSYSRLPARRTLQGEPVAEMVVQFRRQDTGETRWSLTRARAIHGQDGQRLAISIFHDITARKRSEQRLQFLADAGELLVSSLDIEETLQAIVRLATATLADWATVFLVDELEKDELHEAATAHRDAARAPLLERLRRGYPVRRTAQSGVWQVIDSGEVLAVPHIPDEALVQVAQDAEHLALLRALGLTSALYVPLTARGRTLGVLALFTAESQRRLGEDDRLVAQEIAHRAALALDNARLYQAAQAAIQLRDEFLSIASHELRNPVAGLKASAQMLQRSLAQGTVDLERISRFTHAMTTSANRLSVLLEDLLDVSRLQTGQLQLRVQDVDLARLVRESMETRRQEYVDHDLVVHVSCDACLVAADPDRLEQVLDNLLSNAVKYSPAGGEVRVALLHQEGQAIVQVQDAGIGLPPGTADTIFQPFGRAANATAQNIPGLGLGLYICRQIVDSHGGRIWAESPGEGQGTTVSVALPLSPTHADGGAR